MKINKLYYEFFEDTFQSGDFAILQGAKRAGKTTATLQKIYLTLAQRKNSKALIVTDTYARLRDSLLTDLGMICNENPLLTKITWSTTPRVMFRNGSVISFLCSDRDSRGMTSDKDIIFFNESIQYDAKVVRDALKAGSDNCKVIFDYNPYFRFYVNELYEKQDGSNKLITTYRDNPFCPKFAYNELEKQAEIGRNAKPGTFERYIYEVECLGANSELSGLCFPNSEVIDDKEYFDSQFPEILAADWGQILSSADPDVVFGFKFTGDRVLCHEYYYRNDGTDDDIADTLKTIDFNRQYFVFETATAGEARVRNIYNKSGLKFRFVPCSKGVGSVMIGIRNLQSTKICITSSSKNMINEQRNYKFITKNDIMQPADKFNHGFDCLRYAYDFYCNNKTRI